MAILDMWIERLHNAYGERWIAIEVMKSDNGECLEEIAEFFKKCKASRQMVLAHLNTESLFFPEYKKYVDKIESKKILLDRTKRPLTFIVCGDNVVLEDTKQLFIKYNTKILGKKFSERFDELYRI